MSIGVEEVSPSDVKSSSVDEGSVDTVVMEPPGIQLGSEALGGEKVRSVVLSGGVEELFPFLCGRKLGESAEAESEGNSVSESSTVEIEEAFRDLCFGLEVTMAVGVFVRVEGGVGAGFRAEDWRLSGGGELVRTFDARVFMEGFCLVGMIVCGSCWQKVW